MDRSQNHPVQASELLPSGKTINAKFDLGPLQVPEHLKDFEFQIRTRDQHVKMAANGLRNYNASEMEFLQLTGSFSLADHAKKSLVEDLLVATIGGSRLPVSWHMEWDIFNFCSDR